MNEKKRLYYPRDRLEALSDGIFAIVMTLLVLSVVIPNVPTGASPQVFLENFFKTLPSIVFYILTFLLLSAFWITHHGLYAVKRFDAKLLWINLIWLMFIALLPFSTILIGKYSGYELAVITFNLNMLSIGLINCLNWYYAEKHDMLHESVKPYLNTIKFGNIILPFMAILGIILSLFIYSWSLLVYLIIIIMVIKNMNRK
jgi:uncharacterized membrane protein